MSNSTLNEATARESGEIWWTIGKLLLLALLFVAFAGAFWVGLKPVEKAGQTVKGEKE